MHHHLVVLVVAFTACGSPEPAAPDGPSRPAADAPPPCVANAAAPTYHELFTKYFAPGTPGHCATEHCHAGADYCVWLCGATSASCYAGMTSASAGLIDLAYPTASLIADPKNSPLSWINLNGNMPFDAARAFPEGRDAILAWVAACARND